MATAAAAKAPRTSSLSGRQRPQRQAGQGRVARRWRGHGQCHAAAPGHPRQQGQRSAAPAGGSAIKQRHRHLHPPARHHDACGRALLQAFDIVARGATNPLLTRLLNEIRRDVETGTSLSAAFRKHPMYFDALYCNQLKPAKQAAFGGPAGPAGGLSGRRSPSRTRSSPPSPTRSR